MSILNSVPVANISYDTLYPDTKVMSKTSIHYPDCKVNYTTICCIPLIALIDQVPGAGGGIFNHAEVVYYFPLVI